MKVLVVAPAVPAPERKGYQYRLYHQLLGLHPVHQVTLVTLAGPSARAVPAAIAERCRVEVVVQSRLQQAGNAVRHLARLPLTVAYLHDGALEERVRRLRAREAFDVAHVALIRMSPSRRALEGLPRVIDLVDALSLNMRERARVAPLLIRPLLRAEARRLRAYERRELPHYQVGLVVSERDRLALDAPNVLVNPLGVSQPPAPLAAGPSPQPRRGLVFSGTMRYFANADAAGWFATAIFPQVQASEPGVTLTIVGREPGPAVLGLARRPGIRVTGEVPSLWPVLQAAALAVCPMRVGSGAPTKVLEAMAAGTPVVATAKAAAGLPEDLRDLVVVADGAEAFAAAVVRLLRRPEEAMGLAARARERVQTHSWAASVAELVRAYERAVDVFHRPASG